MSRIKGSFREEFLVGLRIAIAQVRDQFRNNLNTRLEKGLLVLAAPMVLLAIVVFFRQSYQVGAATRDGTTFPAVALARVSLLPVMVVLSLFTAMSAMNSIARDSVRPLLLTTVSKRALVVGKLLYTLYTQMFLLGFTLVLLVGYTFGARAPLFPFGVLAVALPIIALTLAVGLSLGYLFWVSTERLGVSDRIRRLLAPLLSILLVTAWVVVVNLQDDVQVTRFAAGGPMTPVGWYADLFFVASPIAEPLGPRTLLATLLVLGAIPFAFAAVLRLAPAYWYATPSSPETDSPHPSDLPEIEGTPTERIGRHSHPVFGRSRTLRATLGYLRDAIRRPDQFVYFFTYLFIGTMALAPGAVNFPSAIPWLFGAGLVLLGVFLGGVFCLNPLGAERPMLSQLALAAVPADTFVNGRILAGVTLGVPFSLVGVGLLGAFGPVSLPAVALGGIFTPVIVLTSVCVAYALGAAMPNDETGEVFNVETLKPSRLAVYIHAGLLLSVTAGGAGVAYVVGSPDSPIPVVGRLGALAVYGLALFVLADGSRRYAVGKLAGYGNETVQFDRIFAIEGAVGLAAISFLFAQSSGLLVGAVLGPVVPVLFLVQYAAFFLVAYGFLYVTRRGRDYLELGRVTPRDGPLVAGTVLGSLAIAILGTVLLSGLDLPGIDNALSDPSSQSSPVAEMGTTTLLVVALVMILVVGPVEELLYRNVIQKYLAEWYSTAPAVGIASGIFTLAHVPVYAARTGSPVATALLLSVLFLVSCLWGAIFARTRRLVVVAAIHGLYNASLVGLVIVGGLPN